MVHRELPLPPHYDPDKVGRVWRVPYQERAEQAQAWARTHAILPAAQDGFKIALVVVDAQNTFCIPGYELFVAGRSGTGAVDDNRRLCAFIYHNLGAITQVFPTMDTHQAIQIFHSIFLVDERGGHPPPNTLVTVAQIEQGHFRFNPAVAPALGISAEFGQQHLLHYVRTLREGGRYQLTIWPYHAMLGGIGHALVPAVEEAIFFHGIARQSQPGFRIKGNHPLTEHYSALGPEVTTGPDGRTIAKKDEALIEKLLGFDAVVVAGQAKSHCVAWTVEDLLEFPRLGTSVYLLCDCTSPVVVPGVVDYTEEADAAFHRFAQAGMRLVRSTDPIARWPGIP